MDKSEKISNLAYRVLMVKSSSLTPEDVAKLKNKHYFFIDTDEWDTLWPIIQERNKRNQEKYLVDTKLKQLEDQYINDLIDEFVEDQYPKEENTWELSKAIRSTIMRDRDPGEESAKEDLEELLKKSPSQIIASSKDSASIGWGVYAWPIIEGLISLGFVFSIFDSAYEQFETIVFALLVMLYIALREYVMSSGFYQLVMWTKLFRFHNDSGNRSIISEQEIRDNQKQVLVQTRKIVTANVFLLIMWLVAIGNLFDAIS